MALLKTTLHNTFGRMIKGGSIGHEDVTSTNDLAKLEQCTPEEVLCWKAHQFCYSHRRSRKLLGYVFVAF